MKILSILLAIACCFVAFYIAQLGFDLISAPNSAAVVSGIALLVFDAAMVVVVLTEVFSRLAPNKHDDDDDPRTVDAQPTEQPSNPSETL